jgi:hypothetical protein
MSIGVTDDVSGSAGHEGTAVDLRMAVMLGSVLCAVAACGASNTTSGEPLGTSTSSPATSVVATATPSPTLAPTPLPVVGTGAASPIIAVKDVASVDPGSGHHMFGDCNSSSYLVPPCPVTRRLGARLDSYPFNGTGGGSSPLCRCQNQGTLAFTLILESGTTAYVHEDLGLGEPSSDLRWTVISIGGTWYVNDQDTGCSATSIYDPAYDHENTSSMPAPPVASC